VLLDASFLIDLEREAAHGIVGPARQFLPALKGRSIVVSVVTIAEILAGAADVVAARAALRRFVVQGLHHAQADRWARLQRHAQQPLGQNDAWLLATAGSVDADVVGADRAAFDRLGSRYLRYR
jgi:predicted nucleic acid-binding protein